jgi:uncharacterized membrane protein YhaH (DUF805 family)
VQKELKSGIKIPIFRFNQKSLNHFYLFFEIIAVIYVLYLNKNMSLENETTYNLFYTWIILNFIFVPINAVSTRRLRDIGINCGMIFLNFIPIINIFFKVFLLVKKGRK